MAALHPLPGRCPGLRADCPFRARKRIVIINRTGQKIVRLCSRKVLNNEKYGSNENLCNCLFLRWFNGYEQQKHYLIRSTEVRGIGPDNKPIKEYIALIIQRSNPKLDEIVSRFDSEIAMFNELK